MSSPFPGMDPFIEASHLWEDFHTNIITEIQNALAPLLPERYVVRAGERSYVALFETYEDESKRALLPDVAVASTGPRARGKPKAKGSRREEDGGGAVIMQALVKAEYRESFLEIRQVDPEHKLVTGIEVLSPSNKRPGTKGWKQYLRKRHAFMNGHANFVEIDLLRRGKRMPMATDWPDSPYYLLVCRKKQAPRCSVWPGHFRQPLPAIPIPLLPSDDDIMLDIQPMIGAIYERLRYRRDIDYHQSLYPPLSREDVAWLEKRLQKADK